MHLIVTIAAVVALSAGLAGPARAQATTMPRFSEIEYHMGRDPLVDENSAMNALHSTPPEQIEAARLTMIAAIPNGTLVGAARATLRSAGAHCQAQQEDSVACTYFDVQTVDEYIDDIHWTVLLHLADGLVAGLAVSRSWARH